MLKKTGNRPKKSGSKGIFSDSRIRLFIFGFISICALFFVFGYSSAKWISGLQDEPSERKKTELPRYPGVKPKKLDAEKIINEEQNKKPVNKTERFTFTKTLEKETAPAVDPFVKPAPKSARQKKKKLVVLKPDVIRQPVAIKKKRIAKTYVKEKSPVREKRIAKTVKRAKAPAKPKPFEGRIYTLQVGSFESASNAHRLKLRLENNGYNAYLQTFITKGKAWHSVRVGTFKTKNSAKRAAVKIKRTMNLSPAVRHYRRGT